jgi:DNA-binding NarL/FixJ family response regulator
MPIRILLADDSEVIRRAIRNLLADSNEIDLAAETDDLAQAIRLTNELKPAVLLFDLHMVSATGFSGLERDLQACPARIVAMSFSNSEADKSLAIHFGANAFVDKADLADELIPTIKMFASKAQLAD